MSLLVCDPGQAARMIAQRRERGLDRFDEVWEGVYIMSPIADDEHQEVVLGLAGIFLVVLVWTGLGKVRPGVNISDRDEGWEKNYRIPDIAVFLTGCHAINRDTHWVGGPDFGVEIGSHGDRSHEKLDFYAQVGTRELLIVDRDPWALELYALKRKKLRLVGRSTLDDPVLLQSGVLPLSFRLVAGKTRPSIEVRTPGRKRPWRA